MNVDERQETETKRLKIKTRKRTWFLRDTEKDRLERGEEGIFRLRFGRCPSERTI